MAHNTIIFLYEIFDVKIHIVLQVITFVVWNIHLKGLLTHPTVSEFHFLSYLTPPFIPSYIYIREIIGVEILGGQRLQTILWNWGFHYYYYYDIEYCIGELFWEYFIFGRIRALTIVMRF